MSHTTKVKSVVIRDVRAIRAAVQELQRAGRKIALKENAVPRMYYKDQFQNSTKRQTAEYVIECQGMSNITGKPCDVGLVKQDDGTFVPYLDTWGNYVKEHCGNPFQSTHSLRSATLPCTAFPAPEAVSIHALLAECDRESIHYLLPYTGFNPRTPCGVRRLEGAGEPY